MRRQVEDWHPSGIRVTGENKIKITAGKRQQKHGVLLRCLYLYLCLLGTLLTLRQDLGLPFRLFPTAGVLLLFSLLAVLKNIWRVWGRRVYTAAYLILLAAAGIGWKHLVAGWRVTENGIRHQLSLYYGVTLAEKTPLLSGERGELLCILVFALLLWSMETTVIRKGRTGLLAASEVLIVLLEFLCGCRFLHPGIFLVGGSVLALVAMGQTKGIQSQKILYRSGLWAGSLILVVSLLAGLAGPFLAERTKDWNEWLYQNVQKKTSELSRALESQNGLFGNHNPTADGSLNNYPVEQKNEIDLTLHTTARPMHNMYLRGFTGGVYQGNSWSAVERRDFEETFSASDSGWQVQNILYRYIRSRSAEGEGSVTVTREHPGGDYGYIPYGFAVPDDGNVQADGSYASAEKANTYTGYVNWTEWLDPQPAQDAESEMESAYREYAAREYLKVPVEGLDRLRAYCEQQDLQSVQEVIDFVVQDVRAGRTYSMDLEAVPADKDFAEYFFFDQKKGYCIHYATTATLMFRLLGVPARYVTGYVVTPEDFTEDGDGYTAQIPDTQAHAWVEVYRSGKGWIPVEVTPGYEDSGSDSAASTDEAMAATPEPTGELQEEPTPEVSGEQPEEVTPEPTGAQSEEITQEPAGGTQENGETPGNTSDRSDASAQDRGTVRLVLKIFVLLLLIAVAAGCSAGTVLLRRKRILQQRKNCFFQKDRNQGICQISYAIYQMLREARELGAIAELPEHRDDRAFAREMEAQIPWMEKGTYRAIVELVEQAAFGAEVMTNEERDTCYQFYQRLEQWLWTQMPKKKRFRWKYIKAYEAS